MNSSRFFPICIHILAILCFSSSLSASQSLVGSVAPPLDIPDQDGKTTHLKQYQGQWVILYFYPKDDTPGCTTEAKNFSRDYAQFKQQGVQIIGVSLDSIESHQQFIDAYSLPFTLLSDTEAKAAKRYQVLLDLGITQITKRQTFVIDPQGIIVKHYQDVEPETHSQQLLAAIPQLKENYK